MFNIGKEQCNTITEKLLWNIQELLTKEAPKKDKTEEKETEKKCKNCGQVHTNTGQFLACAKKHKGVIL